MISKGFEDDLNLRWTFYGDLSNQTGDEIVENMAYFWLFQWDLLSKSDVIYSAIHWHSD